MILRILLTGIVLCLLTTRAHANARSESFLQCHPTLSPVTPAYSKMALPNNLCKYIPSINWQVCANDALRKLSNSDSIWNDSPMKITIAKDPSPNAFLVNQNSIIITSGLTSLINTSEQLSFVIAHEMAHALLDNCALSRNLSKIDGDCQQLRDRMRYSRQLPQPEGISHEVRADDIALLVINKNTIDSDHPISLLTNIAEYQTKHAKGGVSQTQARIASLQSTY